MKIHPKSYSLGYVRGCSDERDQYRIAAFGAIRRAAALARQADREAFDWMDDRYNESYAMARGIRMAIRAAIGSDKA